MEFIVNTFLMGSFGVSVEVIFTALSSVGKKDWKLLEGNSYIWMLFIYGLSYPLFELLWPRIGGYNIVFRGVIYVLCVYIIEYLSGWILRKSIGKCPWEDHYHNKKWSVNDLIRLDYAPFWLGFMLLFERLYLYLV
jgi:uncharacterized membrane protein